MVPDVTGAVRDLLFEHHHDCCADPDQGPYCHWVSGPFAHLVECSTALLIDRAITAMEKAESEEAEALALRVAS